MSGCPGLTNEWPPCGGQWLRSSIGMLVLGEHVGRVASWIASSEDFQPCIREAKQRGCFLFGRFCRARGWQDWRRPIASWLRGVRNPKLAEQGARANAGICHAACFLTMTESETTDC